MKLRFSLIKFWSTCTCVVYYKSKKNSIVIDSYRISFFLLVGLLLCLCSMYNPQQKRNKAVITTPADYIHIQCKTTYPFKLILLIGVQAYTHFRHGIVTKKNMSPTLCYIILNVDIKIVFFTYQFNSFYGCVTPGCQPISFIDWSEQCY